MTGSNLADMTNVSLTDKINISESYLHSLFWNYLDEQPKYKRISTETSLGSAGRIDLLAETQSGEYIGFEIKKDINFDDPRVVLSMYKQLNKYRDSEYIDKLFFVGLNVDVFLNSDGIQTGMLPGDLYKSFGLSISEDELESVREELETRLPEEYLDAYSGVNPTPHEKRKLGKHFDKFMNYVKKSARKDFDSRRHEYDSNITIDEVVQGLDDYWARHPEEVGVIELDVDSFEISMFDSTPELSVTLRREPHPLDRSETPELSIKNEAFVQHHVWSEFGDLREAALPDKESKTERRIDVMGFNGANHPSEIIKNGGEIIGIEAKDDKLTESRGNRITEQLDRYVHSGGLSQIYLAVPESGRSDAVDILDSDIDQSLDLTSRFGSDLLDKVGLIVVDKSGSCTVIREPSRFEIQHDGYRTDGTTSAHDVGHLRTIGYGAQFVHRPSSYVSIYEMGDNDRKEVPKPSRDDITSEEHGQLAVWPQELKTKVIEGSSLNKKETILKYIFEKRDRHYEIDGYIGSNWNELSPEEKGELALHQEKVSREVDIDVSETHIKNTVEDLATEGYIKDVGGKGDHMRGFDGRVKYFIKPLRIIIN